MELPTTPNNLLLKPPSRAKAREDSARKALRSPAALRMRTPAGRNREELESMALEFYLNGSTTIEKMVGSRCSPLIRFLKALVGVMASFERTS